MYKLVYVTATDSITAQILIFLVISVDKCSTVNRGSYELLCNTVSIFWVVFLIDPMTLKLIYFPRNISEDCRTRVRNTTKRFLNRFYSSERSFYLVWSFFFNSRETMFTKIVAIVCNVDVNFYLEIHHKYSTVGSTLYNSLNRYVYF